MYCEKTKYPRTKYTYFYLLGIIICLRTYCKMFYIIFTTVKMRILKIIFVIFIIDIFFSHSKIIHFSKCKYVSNYFYHSFTR